MRKIFNLKTFFSFLSKNKFYTAIEVFGLSISLMFVVFVSIYTVQELSVDKFHTKADRIFIIGSEETPSTGAAIAYKLKERYPEIEKVCPVVSANRKSDYYNILAKVNDQNYAVNAIFADSSFFEIFSFQLLNGDPQSVLKTPKDIVISRSYALRAFGSTDVSGKSITIQDSVHLLVAGVVEDFKNTSFGECDIIFPWRLIELYNPSLAIDQLENASGTMVFVLAHENTDFKSKSADMLSWFKSFFWIYEDGSWQQVRIESLKDFYMSGWGNSYTLESGDRSFIIILVSIALVILLFAVLNYVNLSVAQAGYRYKEMAICRLLGSERKDIFLKLITESILMVLLSFAISILLVFILKSYAESLLKVQLDLTFLVSPVCLVLFAVCIFTIGILSGWIPALIVSSVKPIEIVRGTFRRHTKMILSKFFISFQSLVTSIMLSVVLIMSLQVHYLLNASLGYSTSNILEIKNSGLEDVGSAESFIEEIRNISGVKRAGLTTGCPTSGSNNWTCSYKSPSGESQRISFQTYRMDNECFDMLGLKMIRDNITGQQGQFLNEEAYKQMGLSEDAYNFRINDNTDFIIAGMISDFYEQNRLGNYPPVMFRFRKQGDPFGSYLIEIDGDPVSVRKQIEYKYNEMMGIGAQSSFLDEQIESSFQSQIRLIKIVSVVTIIAILISLLGIVAMSSYFIQQKVREIAVRKVFGSGNEQIFMKLIWTFLKFTIGAFILSVPIVIYIMNEWLTNYSYRISIRPWQFIVIGLFCTLISLFAIGLQSWRASNENPVKFFKQE